MSFIKKQRKNNNIKGREKKTRVNQRNIKTKYKKYTITIKTNTKCTTERIHIPKTWFFKMINKIDKSLG